ncbi:MAG: hypothetical protein SGARI_007767, partial [Bacillariaceae sp.]
MLAVARTNAEDFHLASEELLGSKEFMRKAIAVEGHVIDDAEDNLYYDYDLALLALSQKPEVFDNFVDQDEASIVDEDFEFLVSFAKNMRGKLQDFET